GVLVGLVATLLVASPAGAGLLPGDPPPPPLQGLATGDPPPVTAKTWLVYDDTFEFELAEVGADERRAIASTTKMMTALVAIESSEPDDLVVVSEGAAVVGEAEIGLQEGEVFRIEELITVMLIRSANDAAVAVAEHVGGSLDGFVGMMNAKAEEIGLENTHFANPHGLDAPDHYSSARDLLRIALEGMRYPLFASAVATAEYTFPDAPDGTKRTAETTNYLIRDGYQGALGVKTGYTGEAGLTFVAGAERSGRRLYVVVLGSEGLRAHFDDARLLLDWGFNEFRLVQLFVEGAVYGQYRASEGVEPLLAGQSSNVLLTRTTRSAEVVYEPDFDQEDPVMVATLGEQELARVPLTLSSPRPMPSLGDAFGWVTSYWNWLFDG
ncbi:MAG TPA: D-alanyl-D-alanine carboxypeptidase family protein, partial [Acidimicrobiia bacterium]